MIAKVSSGIIIEYWTKKLNGTYEGEGRMEMKIVHTADLHLGKSFNFARYIHSIQRAQDLKNAFEQIVDYAINERADIFLLAGDVFDRVNPTNEVRVFFIRQMRKLEEAGIQTFAIAGNHDFPKAQARGETALDEAGEAGLCHVFRNPEKLERVQASMNGTTVHIWAKPFDPFREHDSPFDDQEFAPHDGINIIMLHGAFVEGGRRPLGALPYQMQQHPIFGDEIPEGVDYVAIGHIHKPAIHKLPNGAIIGNPGSIETLDRTEQEFTNSFIVAEFGSETKVSSLPLKTRPTGIYPFEITADMEDVTAAILGFLQEIENEEMVLWLDLEGTLTDEQYRTLDMRQIYKQANELFFAYTIDRSKLKHERYGPLFARRVATPLEAFTDFVKRRIEEVPETSRQRYRDALTKGEEYLSDEE